ncbi:hypothetical protein L3Y34_009870 [Caenorhabditis briggsae]|uniref:Uncharacterized protein n=1 Tax=Caenorhabditis briggsae TaxID=6238 RepID=A0AAE9A6D9_CAEBR|nr:hypothetical protein L3Y34_009870 [Caenorhabditis briggsae]
MNSKLIRFMNVNNLNPKSAVFQERVRQNLANAFISTTILSAIPGIIMAVPVGLTFGGFCAIYGAKIPKKLAENPKIDEDSGISEHSGNSETPSEDEKDNNEFFDFQKISPKLKILENSNNLGPQILEYLEKSQKFGILITLRDVATLLESPTTSENTVRIQYKKRKIKIVKIENSGILEMFENSRNSDGSPILILLEKGNSEDFKIQNLAENRQFVMEIKEIFEKNGEEKIVEKSDSEILIIRKGGVVWANSGF